ncbi:5-oxoprolinase subunit B family protein [Actinoalloteichus spitiensis]|uniref:5-oxoprolinase subunit B family protein n=1 Tax=Actinoalloteichus spitiensis TaxID=252394 RepID=UPI0003623186|nr:allophanate hydrolase subunit 1 [Actinoalloteichus spitiensis]
MGDSAFLVEVDSLDDVERLRRALAVSPLTGVTECVPAARTLLLRCADAGTDPASLLAELGEVEVPTSTPFAGGEELRVPVRYDGADLDVVAELTGLSGAEVVARHTAARYRVAFCGFAPGFGYLVGGDPALRVPRLPSPRLRVPAGAVAVADEFSAVYPRESPGGWRLLGRTRLPLWDARRDPPALLTPGTLVRFEEVAS